MPWVADYTSRIAPAALKAASVVGACRYLSRSPWKVITGSEYRELTAAGLGVVLNFEDEANGWLGGAGAGAADASFSAGQAAALGYPAGSPIPSSADFDMTAAQWASAGRAYAVAYRDGLAARGYVAGVYGPWDVLTWCRSLGYTWYWQAGMSTAWSGGRNANPWPWAHLRQRSQRTIGGVPVDLNDILRQDWNGQGWNGQGGKPVSYKLFQVQGHTWIYLSENGMQRRLIGDIAQFTNWVTNHGYPQVDSLTPITVSPRDLDTLAGPCVAGPDPATTGTLDDIRTTFCSSVALTPDQLGQLQTALGTSMRDQLAKLNPPAGS